MLQLPESYKPTIFLLVFLDKIFKLAIVIDSLTLKLDFRLAKSQQYKRCRLHLGLTARTLVSVSSYCEINRAIPFFNPHMFFICNTIYVLAGPFYIQTRINSQILLFWVVGIQIQLSSVLFARIYRFESKILIVIRSSQSFYLFIFVSFSLLICIWISFINYV